MRSVDSNWGGGPTPKKGKCGLIVLVGLLVLGLCLTLPLW